MTFSSYLCRKKREGITTTELRICLLIVLSDLLLRKKSIISKMKKSCKQRDREKPPKFWEISTSHLLSFALTALTAVSMDLSRISFRPLSLLIMLESST
jgi:hypothetical protein